MGVGTSNYGALYTIYLGTYVVDHLQKKLSNVNPSRVLTYIAYQTN